MIKLVISGKEILPKPWSSLMEWLDLLAEDELRDFRDFLISPYFNKEERLSMLYSRIYTARRKDSERINGRDLLKGLFGGIAEETGITKLKNLIDKLEQLVREFLICQENRQVEHSTRNRALVMALKKRRNTELFRQYSDDFRERLNQKPMSIMAVADQWWLEHQSYFHQNARQYRGDSAHFPAAVKNLEQFGLLTRFRYYVEYLNRKNLLAQGQEDDLELTLSRDIAQTNEAPIIQLYILLSRLLQNRQQPALFQEFKHLYLKHQQQIAQADKLVLIKMAINIQVYLTEAGHAGAAEEGFFWAKLGVQEQIFLFEGMISDGDYLNVALVAAQAQHFDYQKWFMDEYRPYLEQEYREKAYHLALAYYYFHQGNFQTTVSIIQDSFRKHAHEEPKYTLRVKSLLIRAYLYFLTRQNNWDCLQELTKEKEGMRKFIDRMEDKLSQDRNLPYKNFIKACNWIQNFHANVLPHLRTAELSKEQSRLFQKISDLKPLACREWLLKFTASIHDKGVYPLGSR